MTEIVTSNPPHAVLHGPGLDEPLFYLEDITGDCSPFSSVDAFGDFLLDGLGSTIGLTRGLPFYPWTNQLAEPYTYDSFGSPRFTGPGPDGLLDTADDVTLPASAFGNPYAFTGREFDPESGLYYYRARYYDPHRVLPRYNGHIEKG